MIIHLKRNEKLYLNGAVIVLDRRGTIELLNDADFLLENHVMQPESATTPLRRLYFLVQAMLMDPKNAHLTRELFKLNMMQVKQQVSDQSYLRVLDAIEYRVFDGKYFDAMKVIRHSYQLENEVQIDKPEAIERSEVAA